MAKKDIGYVYIFTNKSFRDGWVKIGKTRNIQERLRQLDNTSCPLPFDVYATMKTSKYEDAEALVHEFISHFNNELRVRPNREYFKVPPEEALKIFFQVKRVIEDAEIEIFDDKAKKLFKSKISKSLDPEEEESPQTSIPTAVREDREGPRFKSMKVLPSYFAKFSSELTMQAIADIKVSSPISEIRDVNTLIRIRERVKEIEKIHNYHGTHSCAISKLIEYIENGFTYQDFEHDAHLVNNKGDNPEEKPREKAEDGYIFISLKTLPRYYSSLKGSFIKEIMTAMKISGKISDIQDLDILKHIHSEILKKEKVLGIHHTYSCALSQYMQYIENGYSFADLEHDAKLVKAQK